MAQRRGKQTDLADAGDAPQKAAHSRKSERKSGARKSEAEESETSDGPIPEMMRRALTLGLSGFFTTEGALRRALEDTVPKDWTDFLAEASERTRSEFLERISGEIGRVLEGLDIAAVMTELMRGRTLEVKAEFRLLDESADRTTGTTTVRISTPSQTTRESGAAAHDAEAQGDD